MVRTYKRRTPPVKVEKLQAAIAAVENGLTLHTSAKVFAVSASTLHRHLNQKEKPLHRNQVHGCVSVLSFYLSDVFAHFNRFS